MRPTGLDDDDEKELLFGASQFRDDVPAYDRFECEPREDDSRTDTNAVKFFQKLFKFLSYVVFGGIVVGGGLVSKTCLLILVNSAKPYAGGGSKDANDQHDALRAWSYMFICFTIITPELLSMMYCLYRIILKGDGPMTSWSILWGLCWESLHAFGEAILVVKVFPYLDSTYLILLIPVVSFAPSVINLHAKILSLQRTTAHRKSEKYYYKQLHVIFASTALALLIGGLISCFSCFFGTSNWFSFQSKNYTYIWCFFGLILTSCRYWENFITTNIKIGPFKIRAFDLKEELDRCRFKANFIFAFVKCCIVTGMTFFIFVVLEDGTYHGFHATVAAPAGQTNTMGSSVRYAQIASLLSYSKKSNNMHTILLDLTYVYVTQVCCSIAVFFFGRVACLTMIQRQAYSLPAALVTPTMAIVSAVLAVYKHGFPKRNFLSFMGLQYLYKSTPTMEYYIDWNNVGYDANTTYSTVVGYNIALVISGLIIGWCSILLVTQFIWFPKHNKLERMEVLFMKPLYGGPMIDEVLMMNRRQFEDPVRRTLKDKERLNEMKRQAEIQNAQSRSFYRQATRRLTLAARPKFVPQLFLCTTMWHETKDEMTQILTSLMRLDKDQGRRRQNPHDDDYYEFQVHVLFDDAFCKKKDKDGNTYDAKNDWVQQLRSLIPLAANKVDLGSGQKITAPVIYPTPYGGRLEYVMPHGNLLIVHLKNKDKIRHRKRWSQCMYMYYILGYLQAHKKVYKLNDIFILALDGDVDFQPKAVHLVLDRMKRNPDVGAVCGRIHPTGSGPMVWFQKFEYAVGHWLQKTTEHVLGCVLCSPGCFSLFRGAAIVDVNVMHQYVALATEARHYVQWDQGEDRWLCTLLLKQGWRIEYAAASDSFTFAPEDFKEFFNQRRRWGPSTMANILDILQDAKITVENNAYISWGYISYQIGLMVSSILGPATVILIVQGALMYVFHWNAIVSLFVSLTPVILYIIVCSIASKNTQVGVAGILTIVYAMIMMAVLVSILGSLLSTPEIYTNINNLFFLALAGIYVFTGVVHPLEMTCLLHGVLYYLTIPSAFILLMVYSLQNMDDVSWGTREGPKKPEDEVSPPDAAAALQEVAAKPGTIQVGATIYDTTEAKGYYSCGLGNFCQCAMCIQPQPAKPRYMPVPVTEPPHSNHLGPITQENNYAERRLTHGLQRDRRLSMRPNHLEDSKRRYSKAKGAITGVESNVIERNLSRRLSLNQIKSSNYGDRTMSTALTRRLSRHSLRKEAPGYIMEDVEEEDEEEYAFSDTEHDDELDHIDSERLEEEKEENIQWALEDTEEDDGWIQYLDDDELNFWKYLIERYLYPLYEDKAEKERIKGDLQELRNKVCGSYYLANALWIVLSFMFQLTFFDTSIDVSIFQQQNPATLIFLFFFLIILMVQFFSMIAHRWSTALHVLSQETLKWNSSRDGFKNVSEKERIKHDQRMEKIKKAQRESGFSSLQNESSFSHRMGDNGHVNLVYEDPDEMSSAPPSLPDREAPPPPPTRYQSVNFNLDALSTSSRQRNSATSSSGA